MTHKASFIPIFLTMCVNEQVSLQFEAGSLSVLLKRRSYVLFLGFTCGCTDSSMVILHKVQCFTNFASLCG